MNTVIPDARALAARIQHTRIEPAMTSTVVRTHCGEALDYGFNAVMIPGSWVSLASTVLAGTGVLVASAVDFPIAGSMSTEGKVAEAVSLVGQGAVQLDIGVGVGWLKSADNIRFRDDIAAVVQATGVPIKVMLELPLLTVQERELAVALAVEAGAAYLKNASGGAVGRATPADIAFLRRLAPAGVGVKASGGISTTAHALELFAAGADLVGTSAGIRIVTNEESRAGATAY